MITTSVKQKDYSYTEIVNMLFAFKDRFGFLDVFPIGKTVIGRDIYAARLGTARREILYSSAIHGSERLTAAVTMIYIEQLCEALLTGGDYSISSARNALFGKSAVFIPVSNPDGYEIARAGAATAGARAEEVGRINGNNDIKYWNANARGVDINHNFDAGWENIRRIEQEQGINGPSPRKFGGYKPESEPETAALCDYCRSNDVRQLICLHSQGEEIYWQFGANTPPKSRRLASLYATASGYVAARPAPSADGGGFKDWFIEKFGRPGFTLEIGKGVNPLDPSALYSIYEKLPELFLLSLSLT